MSITTIIDEENITIVQGINGIMLYKEEWMKKTNKDKQLLLAPKQ